MLSLTLTRKGVIHYCRGLSIIHSRGLKPTPLQNAAVRSNTAERKKKKYKQVLIIADLMKADPKNTRLMFVQGLKTR